VPPFRHFGVARVGSDPKRYTQKAVSSNLLLVVVVSSEELLKSLAEAEILTADDGRTLRERFVPAGGTPMGNVKVQASRLETARTSARARGSRKHSESKKSVGVMTHLAWASRCCFALLYTSSGSSSSTRIARSATRVPKMNCWPFGKLSTRSAASDTTASRRPRLRETLVGNLTRVLR
jgi:hypothetical protein